jgi:glyoxylase-like metal-dependent hydrolase (beta-lactamase superfamily II)
MRTLLVALAALALASSPLSAQQNFDNVQIRTVKVSAGVYVLMGAGGNIGLSVGENDAFIIDDQYAPLTPKVLAAIRAVTRKPVRFVLNTHLHGDHTGGNENFGRAGALIVAHHNVRRRMSVEQFNAFLDRRIPAAAPSALPVVTFSDVVTFHLNGDEIRAVHVVPSHTDGDAVVHFQRANALHAGDVFVRYGYPYVDISAGGSIDGMIEATGMMLSMVKDDTKIIPGHGEVATKKDLQQFHDVLVIIRDRVRGQIAQGKSLGEVKAAKPTAEFDATWRNDFVTPDKFVEIVYTSLTKK